MVSTIVPVISGGGDKIAKVSIKQITKFILAGAPIRTLALVRHGTALGMTRKFHYDFVQMSWTVVTM
ncbi:MAG TPA: hypothetical protein VNF68_09880, partial [Candidatus Baltobacteraceae bacterium]|nr:hypothetical protein [Candidatus Baltobacteraceae bacterium]